MLKNQVMVKSPSCRIDPFQAKLNKRRITEITRTAGPLLRDVIDLKQAIDQATNLISIKSDQLIIR